MNYILLILFVACCVALFRQRVVSEKQIRIDAAKQRAKEASERTQPMSLYMEHIQTDSNGIHVHDVVDEQSELLRKIFEGNSIFLDDSHSNKNWSNTEPSKLTKE